MVNTDGSLVLHERLCDGGVRNGMGGAAIFLALWAFRHKVLDDTHRYPMARIALTEGEVRSSGTMVKVTPAMDG